MTDQDVSTEGERRRLEHAAFSRGATDDDVRRLARFIAEHEAPPLARPADEVASESPPLDPTWGRRRLLIAAVAGAALVVAGGFWWQSRESEEAPTGVSTPPVATSAPVETGAPTDATAPPADDQAVPSPLSIFDRPASAHDEPETDVAETFGLTDVDTRRIAEVEGIPVYVVAGELAPFPDAPDERVRVVCLHADSGVDTEYASNCAAVSHFEGLVLSLALTNHVVRWGLAGVEATVSLRG